jgi:hypothetical protein
MLLCRFEYSSSMDRTDQTGRASAWRSTYAKCSGCVGEVAELIDAKAVGLPMIDRMYKEFSPGEAPT